MRGVTELLRITPEVTPRGLSVSPSSAVTSAALSRAVAHVIGIRAEEQVGRIHTRRVIAAVQHEQAVRDRTDHQLVSGGKCKSPPHRLSAQGRNVGATVCVDK